MPADRLLHPRAGHSNKVTLLTDLEYRVWTQYLLSADEFGVMRALPLAFQNDNDHLASRTAKQLQRCIDVLVRSGLVRAFEHQGKPYLYQHDWQKWQKVEYPRATNNPKPDDLYACDEGTCALFAKHPGGQRKDRRRSDDDPNHLERASRTHPESVPPTRAVARETANANGSGEWLAANGSGPEPEFPGDVWWAYLLATYPKNRVTNNVIANQAFIDILKGATDGPNAAWARMRSNLDNQKRGHEWRIKGMVPSLQKWLESGAWEQVHDEQAPVVEQLSPRTNRTLAAAANILRRNG